MPGRDSLLGSWEVGTLLLLPGQVSYTVRAPCARKKGSQELHFIVELHLGKILIRTNQLWSSLKEIYNGK
jgi:predicted phosphohydrolase